MILSDSEILQAMAQRQISIAPEIDFDVQLQPASIDLRLGDTFKVYKLGRAYEDRVIDLRKNPIEPYMSTLLLKEGERFVLEPGMFALGTTLEYITLGPQFVGRVDGRSSWGRLGLTIHATAGFIDPGFEGNITLEFGNAARFPIALYPGDRICQISLHRMARSAQRPYGAKRGSKYHGQKGVTASKLHEDHSDKETQTPNGKTH